MCEVSVENAKDEKLIQRWYSKSYEALAGSFLLHCVNPFQVI